MAEASGRSTLIQGFQDLSFFAEDDSENDGDGHVEEEELSYFESEIDLNGCSGDLEKDDLSYFDDNESQMGVNDGHGDMENDDLSYFDDNESQMGVNDGHGDNDDLSYFAEEMENDREDVDGYNSDEEGCHSSDKNAEDDDMSNSIQIDCLADICTIDMKSFVPQEVCKIDFLNLDVAYLFYVNYARANGFAVRKFKVIRSRKSGEILQQDFVCNKNGKREDRGLSIELRKREPRLETRCGCKAKFRVHVDIISKRWYCTCFTDIHCHPLYDDVDCGMQAPHRKMSLSDIVQMNGMMKVGMGVCQIFRSIANQCGGPVNVQYDKKDMHNQLARQRRMLKNDAVSAMQFLANLHSKDKNFYCEGTTDHDDRLQHLFWADGIGRLTYQVYGDVLAFDATYGKNQYLLPVVIFSGVNNHNRTTIFATAVVTNESEETYVWLLEQFFTAMKGKAPTAIITDGHQSMRNAIKRVFPKAHHRLCAWHLLKNANTNIGNPLFTQAFKNCMFGDYDVGKFERKWGEIVAKLGLQSKKWVIETYEKRKMWSAAHLRGKFFAGFRTTSRCEGFHSELAKYVHSRNNLTDFLQQLCYCVEHMRFREIQDDFHSINGEPVLQTNFKSLEMSAAKHFTHNLFLLFRPVLQHAPFMKVIGCKEALTCSIFTVVKVNYVQKEWHVSYYSDTNNLSCSCFKMESRGLPCEHIVAVLAHLKIEELPECLILKRWTKGAADGIYSLKGYGNDCWDSQKSSRCGALMDLYRQLSALNSNTVGDFNDAREKANSLIEESKAKSSCQKGLRISLTETDYTNLKDPLYLSRKGGVGKSKSSLGLRPKRIINCSICKTPGHNKQTCPYRPQQGDTLNAHDNGEGELNFFTTDLGVDD